MIRYIDWPERLMLFLNERHDKPINWENNNCCFFGCDAVKAISGQDPGHFFRGKVKTPKQAYKLLKKFSGGGVEESAEKIFNEMGIHEIPVEDANSGDIALIDVENVHPDAHGYTVAVVTSPASVVAQGKDGLVYITDPDMKRAWGI